MRFSRKKYLAIIGWHYGDRKGKTCLRGIPTIYLGVVLRHPGWEEIFLHPPAPDRKRAATLSQRRWDRKGRVGGIKGHEINASISWNTVEHSSPLWRRACTPPPSFYVIGKSFLSRLNLSGTHPSALRPEFSLLFHFATCWRNPPLF